MLLLGITKDYIFIIIGSVFVWPIAIFVILDLDLKNVHRNPTLGGLTRFLFQNSNYTEIGIQFNSNIYIPRNRYTIQFQYIHPETSIQKYIKIKSYL